MADGVAGPAPERQAFSEVSALTPSGPGRFQGEVHPGWTISGKPNGGYLLAMMGRAAATLSSHAHVVAASAHYLRSPGTGAVVVEAQLLRAGRSVSQVRARMSQDGEACVEALLTTGELGGTAADWDGGLPAMGELAWEECRRLPPHLPDGSRVAILEQVEVRLDPTSSGFTTGAPSDRGELRGWLALPAAEAFDPISLLFAIDAFPPATFDIADFGWTYSGWVPTLALTAYVRALPVAGRVRVLQRAQLIDAQRVDESCFVWDGAGRLVAQGSQLAGLRQR